jgi:hypothetical protein
MAQTNVNIEFNHLLNGNEFNTTQNGINNLGEEFEVSRLEYYVSRIRINFDDGQTQNSAQEYGLIDAFENSSINFGVIDGNQINSITFFIGVDPETNHLDPASWPNDHPLAPQNPSMHWGWTSGYRFLAMEGSDITTNQNFELHGLEDENYFSVILPVDMEISEGEMTLVIDANYEQILNNIELAQGPLIHGGYGLALVALENMANDVFEFSGISLGVSDAFPNVAFNVFPNPTINGLAQITVDGLNNERIDLQVFDILGKSVFEASGIANGKNTQLNLTKAGMYIVRISTNGVTIATQKLVVQ